jgi:hypothetical protein
MKFYFRKWKESETSDNFFRWSILLLDNLEIEHS